MVTGACQLDLWSLVKVLALEQLEKLKKKLAQ
jgi:hypothetical protein